MNESCGGGRHGMGRRAKPLPNHRPAGMKACKSGGNKYPDLSSCPLIFQSTGPPTGQLQGQAGARRSLVREETCPISPGAESWVGKAEEQNWSRRWTRTSTLTADRSLETGAGVAELGEHFNR